MYMDKRTLSITINHQLYDRLQEEIGRGRISQLTERLIEEHLDQRKNNLAKAYQEAYQEGSPLLELSKKWENAQNQDWLNFKK